MNWNDLTSQQQEAWNKVAENNQNLLVIAKQVRDKGCPMCSHKPTNWTAFEFHILSTHGFPREMLIEICKGIGIKA